jgi:hypothetical protein
MRKNSAIKQPVDIALGLVSQARLAALFGRSREWVRYIAKRGIIRRVDAGNRSGPNALYDLEDSIRQIAEYLSKLGREAPASRLEAAVQFIPGRIELPSKV